MSCIGWIAVGYLQRHKSHINFDLSLEKKKQAQITFEEYLSYALQTLMKNPSQIRK